MSGEANESRLDITPLVVVVSTTIINAYKRYGGDVE
jgi:hypothetical protein